ncbi:MAG: hypothetical protein ACPG5W_01950, partial [Flavobacteriales bacterium]
NKKLWGLADLTIVIIAFSLAMVMGEMGPTRTWLPITFIVVSVAAFIAYQLGTWVYIKSNGKLFQLVVIAQIMILAFQAFTGYSQYRTTKLYSAAVDERMHQISTLKTDFLTIQELEPLPDPGWLFTSEISTDTSHFSNKHLELFFENKFHLAVKEPVSSSSE